MKELKGISDIDITQDEKNIVRTQKDIAEKTISEIHKAEYSLFFYIPKEVKKGNQFLEECRKAGDKLQSLLNEYKIRKSHY